MARYSKAKQTRHRLVVCRNCKGKHLTDDNRLCNNPQCGGTGFVLVNMEPSSTTEGLNRLMDDIENLNQGKG